MTLCRLGVFLLLSSVAACTAQADAGSKGTEVIVEAVQEDIFSDPIEALGTLHANESVRLTINVSEIVSAIHFEDGQFVNKGDVLVEMTSAEEQALLEEALSALHESKQQLERTRSLSSKNIAAQSVLDERERDYRIAEAKLTAVQSRLQDRLVVAPFSGVVGLRTISVGSLVVPGDLITTLIDNSRMKLDFSVPAIYLPVLEPGLPVTARMQGLLDGENNNALTGEVVAIDNQIDPVTRTIAVRAVLPNVNGLLKPGLLMQVQLQQNVRKAVVISEEALIHRARDHFVWVAVEKAGQLVAEKRKVVVGARRKGQVEILDGLSSGEQVITHGALKVRPDQPVRIGALLPATPDSPG